ncbi:aromatic acid exporter family protein [uncultured Amnibacterium sp.]|uniref:FUSC family protein n=1 Tax=uncultured Amnibacterium sp. TaxID=1631851 RepID=UPI0035CCA8AF
MSAGRGRRVLASADPRAAIRRSFEAIPAAAQLAIAATASYAFAHVVVGHQVPLLAITVCLSSLGFVRDARPKRVVETAVGLSIGVALAEAMLLAAGRGVWQISVALFVTLLIARLLNAPPPVAVAATAQSAIVLLIQLPAGGTWARSVDGFIGGAIALLATALVPRDPRRAAQRDGSRVLTGLRRGIDDAARALRTADRPAASAALAGLRDLQPAIADWTTTLDSAIAIARVSPFLHRRLPELVAQRRLLDGVELAVRSMRTIARRAEAVTADAVPRPQLAELLQAVGSVVALLARSLRDPTLLAPARDDLQLIARRLDPREITPEASVTASIITVLIRPVVVDLAVAAGVPADEIRAALPTLS